MYEMMPASDIIRDILRRVLEAEGERLVEKAKQMRPISLTDAVNAINEERCVDGTITPIIDDPTRLLA